MASGNHLFTLRPGDASQPATLNALLAFVVGTSTPVEGFPVLVFDPSTIWYADFHGLVMPAQYAGGGLTLSFRWSTTVTTNNVIWSAALRGIPDDAEDLNTTAFTYDYNDSGGAVAPSAAGETSYDNITFTSGADMDSVAAADSFSLRIRRNATSGSDTCTGNGELHEIYVTET